MARSSKGRGAASVVRSYRGKNRIARTGKPRVVRATTDNAQLRLRGDLLGGFDQTTTGYLSTIVG